MAYSGAAVPKVCSAEPLGLRKEREGARTLDVEEAASIPEAKSVLSSDNIYGSFAFLKAHSSDLPKYIEYLESSSLQLKDAIGVIDSLLQKQIPGPVGEAVTLKLKEVLQRNPGFEKMKDVCSILQAESFNFHNSWYREFDIWCRHPQKGKGVVLFKQYPGANKWICKHEGLSNSEWRDGIKMIGNVAAVRAVPGRSQDNRCRHCHNEVETLAHVLGSCPHGEALRNARHHQVRSIIATALKHADYNTFEEVHGLSVTGNTRRIDIIAFKESTRSGYIIDPTVRFETNEEQPVQVDNEKKNIYNPTIPYYLKKYQLKELEVIGLLVGARGTATLFMKDVFKRLGIPTSIIPIVTLAALKGSIDLLNNHLYS
ncbi:hypothetical protein ANN_24036 [Periplaneta americana]|uniref:Reverse transcriptase n=1 Tax=Periplaneta americana TaxID=6978 RepID=A0ABQ8S206_PERAM|nr:hypothetical protein ANN_24036 [Periplaneta americana]